MFNSLGFHRSFVIYRNFCFNSFFTYINFTILISNMIYFIINVLFLFFFILGLWKFEGRKFIALHFMIYLFFIISSILFTLFLLKLFSYLFKHGKFIYLFRIRSFMIVKCQQSINSNLELFAIEVIKRYHLFYLNFRA